jgi:hypothetical protein
MQNAEMRASIHHLKRTAQVNKQEVLAHGAVGPVVVAGSHLATRYTVTVMDGPNKAIHAQVPVLVMDLL